MTVPYNVFWNDGELPTIYVVVNHWTVHEEITVSSTCVPHQAIKNNEAEAMNIREKRFIDQNEKNKSDYDFSSELIYARNFWTSSDLTIAIALSHLVISIRSSPGLISIIVLTSFGITI